MSFRSVLKEITKFIGRYPSDTLSPSQNATRIYINKKSNKAAFSRVKNKGLFVRTWKLSGAAPSEDNWQSVCWSPELGMFVAIAQGSTATMKSYDGITWTASGVAPSAANWYSVCWSPELGMFVAVNTNTTLMMKSRIA